MEINNIYIESYGCSANLNNSEIIKGLLQQAGLFTTNNPKIADIAIINTCIVKGPTEERMFSRIKELTKSFGGRLIVVGCMPDVLADEIRKISPKVSLVGSHHMSEIAKAVRELSKRKIVCLIGQKNEIKLCMPKINTNKIIGITQILEGCVGNCSYCITRYAKGRLFSYPKEQVIKNVKNDLQNGCKEIWLTSQDNAAYGLDEEKADLPSLLNKVIELRGRFLLRLGMMNPNHLMQILEEMIECYKKEKMFKFLHIPLQSGSNKILKDMKRDYKKEEFVKIVKKFREEFPAITISTDVIVGYPTEREADFQDTLQIIRDTKPSVLNISKFWPREGTEAAKLGQLSVDKSKKRAIDLMNLHKSIAFEENKKSVGWQGMCLVDKYGFENTWLARNINYNLIILKGENLIGKFLNVKVTKAMPHYLFADVVRTNQH